MKFKVDLKYRSYETVEVEADNEKQAIERAIEIQPRYRREYGQNVYSAEIRVEP